MGVSHHPSIPSWDNCPLSLPLAALLPTLLDGGTAIWGSELGILASDFLVFCQLLTDREVEERATHLLLL